MYNHSTEWIRVATTTITEMQELIQVNKLEIRDVPALLLVIRLALACAVLPHERIKLFIDTFPDPTGEIGNTLRELYQNVTDNSNSAAKIFNPNAGSSTPQ